MINTQKLKIGDIFRVPMDGSTDRYFQYICTDITQLNSDVVRVFQGAHKVQIDDINQIVKNPVDFYAHVFLKIGLKQGCWQKIGHCDDIGHIDIMFRNSNDYGNPNIEVSHDWHVWRVNQPFKRIGMLAADYQNAEIGVVVPPKSLVHHMRTGRYDFVYPDY